VEINEGAVQILNDLNIRFTSYFLIDPDFEQSNFKNLANYVNKNHLIRPRFVVLTPLPGTKLYEQNKSRINLNYDFFDFMHWVYPPRLKQIEFFNHLVDLYYLAFSFHRYFKILWNNILVKFKRVNLRAKQQKNISLIELILLRIMAFPLRRKLFRQYFQTNI
jgi:radical SAM superfamily enzyme YgiQ (UPF0313 family)